MISVTDVYDVAVRFSSQTASSIFCGLITRPGGQKCSSQADLFSTYPIISKEFFVRARAALDPDHGSR